MAETHAQMVQIQFVKQPLIMVNCSIAFQTNIKRHRDTFGKKTDAGHGNGSKKAQPIRVERPNLGDDYP